MTTDISSQEININNIMLCDPFHRLSIIIIADLNVYHKKWAAFLDGKSKLYDNNTSGAVSARALENAQFSQILLQDILAYPCNHNGTHYPERTNIQMYKDVCLSQVKRLNGTDELEKLDEYVNNLFQEAKPEVVKSALRYFQDQF